MAQHNDVMDIVCLGCSRKVTVDASNELVGKQHRLKCKHCGHRGARIVRYWDRDRAPKKNPGQ